MEFLSTCASVIIASLALFLTVWSIQTQRIHNRLSVKPYLLNASDSYFDGVEKSGLLCSEIKNHGAGSAIIKSFQLYSNGKPCDYLETLDKIVEGIENTKLYNREYLSNGSAIKANGSEEIFKLTFVCHNKEIMKVVSQKFDHLQLIIKCECVYGIEQTYELNKWLN